MRNLIKSLSKLPTGSLGWIPKRGIIKPKKSELFRGFGRSQQPNCFPKALSQSFTPTHVLRKRLSYQTLGSTKNWPLKYLVIWQKTTLSIFICLSLISNEAKRRHGRKNGEHPLSSSLGWTKRGASCCRRTQSFVA